ncbi:MAG: hypothetical protein HC838_05925 [Spirulinaceae cyanobacterium RM2_2_10]|nr:hypothetical protein [Spirulinaceae cyanobacterium RM2_2_10]
MTKAVSKLVQRSALLTGGALITTAALLVAEPAAAIRIDFDESNVVTGPGEIITDQWAADYGLTVSATDKGGKNSRNLLLFNSSCDPVANDGSTDDLTLCTGAIATWQPASVLTATITGTSIMTRQIRVMS